MAKFLDDNGLLYFWERIKTTFAQLSDIPTKTSDLANDSYFISDQTYVHTDNNFTSLLKNKLDNIENGAQVNAIDIIQINGSIVTPSGKAVNITVPTRISDLSNDGDYQTSEQVNAAIASAMAGITGISFEIVSMLPSVGVNGRIYLVPITARINAYDEYIFINNTWERIGTTDVNLNGYWNSTNLTTITNSEIDSIIAS